MKTLNEILKLQVKIKCILITLLVLEITIYLLICVLSYLSDDANDIVNSSENFYLILSFCLYLVLIITAIYIVKIANLKALNFVLLLYIGISIVTLIITILLMCRPTSPHNNQKSTIPRYDIPNLILKILLIILKIIVSIGFVIFIKTTRTVNSRLEISENFGRVETLNNTTLNSSSTMCQNHHIKHRSQLSICSISNSTEQETKNYYNESNYNPTNNTNHSNTDKSQRRGSKVFTKNFNQNSASNQLNQLSDSNNVNNANTDQIVYHSTIASNYNNTSTNKKHDESDEEKDVVDSLRNNEFSNAKYTYGFNYIGEESLNSKKFSTPKHLTSSPDNNLTKILIEKEKNI